jgi:non-specific serine/threonine protein kinase
VEGSDDEPRFMMLELLREFGLEQLEASGEAETIRHRHASFFLALAEASLKSAEQVKWMDRMEHEHDNLRAALDWSTTAEDAGELCLRLAGTLGHFWEIHGHLARARAFVCHP